MSKLDFKVLSEVFSKNFINLLIDDPIRAIWKLKTLTIKFDISHNDNGIEIKSLLDSIYNKLLSDYNLNMYIKMQ